MHKSAVINDSLDNLSFSIDIQSYKKSTSIVSKNAASQTRYNVVLDDSMFNDVTYNNQLENYEVTPPSEKKITHTVKEISQIKLFTQSNSTITKLSSWGLSSTVLEEYAARKITTMFPWQCECLLSDADILAKQKNLIYSAPTSAGKTLVAEIITIKTVLERRKKVIFILPFVSVVREKMLYFQDILGTSGVRVEGYMGSYNPPGGFQNIQVAICTMEKANGLINRLLEECNLSSIGAVIVDELHMLGDSSRGYLLELLLTKLLYMSKKDPEIGIQIIGMSATLPNLDVLASWLDASLYTTQFRPIPLVEQCRINGSLYDHKMNFLRKLEPLEGIDTDMDNILQLCLEPIKESCSVLIFCPSKQWCENLALQIAEAFYKLGKVATTDMGKMLRTQLSEKMIIELLDQLKACPVGLDSVLKKTVSFAVAYHHAGLTLDERDIIEGAFRCGGLRVLVATSTLSSGVNLPARRVIVRTPRAMGGILDALVYRQMIGRAGRMGKDTSGDSVLVCKAGDEAITKALMGAKLTPVESCLEGAGKLKRAILEVISSGVATSENDVNLFTKCTLLAKNRTDIANIHHENENTMSDPISEAISFLITNEFIRKQTDENNDTILTPTSLARACLSASMGPDEGLALFSELERARRCIVLETDLHLVYLVTPYSACASWPQIDWMQYMDIWEHMAPSMRRVGDLVGVRSAFLMRTIQCGMGNPHYSAELFIHKRFFVSLALQELINEVPLCDVSIKFSCNRGLLQSLQQSAATFAGMVTAFSRQLGWASVELLIGQFQDRLHFGVARELLDLMRLPLLNSQRARILHTAGIETLVNLANTSANTLENILHKATPFVSGRHIQGMPQSESNERKDVKCIWTDGKNEGLTEREAAILLVSDARKFLQLEMGLQEAKWSSASQECVPEKYNESDNDILVEKMRNNSINEESNILAKLINQDVYKSINKDSKNAFVLDKIFPDFKSDNKHKIDKKENIKDQNNKLLNNIMVEDKGLSTSVVGNNDYKNATIVESDEVSLVKKISFQEVDLDLSDKLSCFTFLSGNLKHVDSFKGSLKTIAAQPDDLNSPTLFEDSIDSLFGLENFTQLFETLKTKEPNTDMLNETNISDVSLNLHLSLESKKSNLDEVINFSNEFTFDDSFDNNIENINLTKDNNIKPEALTNSDSGLFENDSVFEQAFANSFNQDEKENIQEDHQNIQEDNQNMSDNIIEDSPKNTKTIYETSRVLKRTRLDSKNVMMDEDILLSSPKKKSKFSVSILEENRKINYSSIQIIDVCKTEDAFTSFSEKLLQQKTVSFSLACAAYKTPRHTIGPTVSISKLTHTLKLVSKDIMLMGISFYWKNNMSNVYFLSLHENYCGSESKIYNTLKTFFSTNERLAITFDAKKQIKILKNCSDISFECCANDPRIADWLVEPENIENNFQDMCLRYCPEMEPLFKLVENCSGNGSLGCNIYTKIDPRVRASVEALATWHLMAVIKNTMKNINEHLLNHFEIEMGCIKLLAEMELVGIGISKNKLQSLSDTLKKHLRGIETFAFSLAGRRFNFSSSADVAKVLGLSKSDGNSKKKMSTCKQVLEHNDHPIAKLVLHWRKMNTTLTHLVHPLLRLVDVSDGRIRGTCVTRTATGRVSMHEPNIQNAPKQFHVDYMHHTELVINCRQAFICKEEHILISADYCQLELRLLAHLSADSVLCAIMRQKDQDVFKQIAAKWNDIDEKDVTDPLRQNAKKLCYGIIYGMGKKAIGEQLTITEEEAMVLLESFHKKYTCIKEYILKTVKSCRQNGYVETISGRRRFLPNINHQHAATKSQAERQAVNTTIQGSAADIVKTAMVMISKMFKDTFRISKHKPQLVLHIHDELLYEIPEKSVQLAARIIKTSMETSVKLSVPFPVKLKMGKSWGEMSEYVV